MLWMSELSSIEIWFFVVGVGIVHVVLLMWLWDLGKYLLVDRRRDKFQLDESIARGDIASRKEMSEKLEIYEKNLAEALERIFNLEYEMKKEVRVSVELKAPEYLKIVQMKASEIPKVEVVPAPQFDPQHIKKLKKQMREF